MNEQQKKKLIENRIVDKELQQQLANIYGSPIAVQIVEITNEKVFGTKKPQILVFDIFDGFAYCYEHNGKEYAMKYPTTDFIKKSKEFTDSIRSENPDMKIEDISVQDIIKTYGALQCVNDSYVFGE